NSRVRSREALAIKWKPPLFRAPTIFHIPHPDCSIGESTTDTTREHVHTHTSGILKYHLHLRKMEKDGKCQTIRGTAIFKSPTRIMELT
ncbi:hypothetical protein ALC57_11191, partial [Trachymyrmex cornetzi]